MFEVLWTYCNSVTKEEWNIEGNKYLQCLMGHNPQQKFAPKTLLRRKSSSLYNAKGKEARVIILACDTPLGAYPQTYSIVWKYLEACRSYGAHKHYPKSLLRENNYEKRTVRLVSYARDTLTHPHLDPNRMLSKDLKGHRNYWAHKLCLWADGRTRGWSLYPPTLEVNFQK